MATTHVSHELAVEMLTEPCTGSKAEQLHHRVAHAPTVHLREHYKPSDTTLRLPLEHDFALAWAMLENS